MSGFNLAKEDKGITGLGREDPVMALNLIQSSEIGRLYNRTNVEDPLVLRSKAADFRKGYKNWRQKKSKGAKGESTYLLDNTKVHAGDQEKAEQYHLLDTKKRLLEDAERIQLAMDQEEPPSAQGISKAQTMPLVVVEDDDLDLELSGLTGEKPGERPRLASSMSRRDSFAETTRRDSFKRSASIGAFEDVVEHVEGEDWLKFYLNPFSGMGELEQPVTLNQESLKELRRQRQVKVPHYDRPSDREYVDNYICHMGVGGFHRSHEAFYTDDVLNSGSSPSWGICGIGLMPWDSKMYNILKKQDYLYTLLTRSPNLHEARVIGSIVDFIHAPEDHSKAIAKLANPSTRIVSLTVTEKGYCTDNEGKLDKKNKLVQHDLETDLATPQSAIGMIIAGLRRRKEEGTPSFTVMSCDNLPENGDKIKSVVLEMAGEVDPVLREWVAENTTFPNTMVDRITPATEQEHIEILKKDYMVADEWPVIAEDFHQWVIEDHFCDGRPDWGSVGAMLVDDVKPYEFMKLRLLNGGHSSLSYIGYLSGYTYVDDAMNDDVVAGLIRAYFREMSRTLGEVPGINISEYAEKLAERFGNPYIKDKLSRLAEDGSMKMLNTLREATLELTERGEQTRLISLANACFLLYMKGEDAEGDIIEIKDPRAIELQDLSLDALKDKEPTPKAFLTAVYGEKVSALEDFVCSVKNHIVEIQSRGAKEYFQAVLEALVGDGGEE